MSPAKSYAISKGEVWAAYTHVKANQGAAGVDRQTIAQFETRLKDNLYRIWNRMSSGSYFPPPVRSVAIPKASGTGVRLLGIPTVSDRIAQAVVKKRFESVVDPLFHPDSYGYRPKKSAAEALGVARRRCWEYDWVLDLDVEKFFDTVPHDLVLRAVRKHARERWVVRYIERWLTSPRALADGTVIPSTRGTPQGGVVSPVLANLLLHYVFDEWMRRHYPHCPFERYADDIVIHCLTEAGARELWSALAARFEECGLKLNAAKTQVVYCKDSNRRGSYPTIRFDFLGYTFRPRKAVQGKTGNPFTSFSPAISRTATTRVRAQIRNWKLSHWMSATLYDVARWCNPRIRGWLEYYGHYGSAAARAAVIWPVTTALLRWIRRKYPPLRRHPLCAEAWLWRVRRRHPTLFAHWWLQPWHDLSPGRAV